MGEAIIYKLHLFISGASEGVSGASERANGRVSGPVLPSVFLAVIDHSAVTDLHSLITSSRSYAQIMFEDWDDDDLNLDEIFGKSQQQEEASQDVTASRLSYFM